MTDNNKRKIFAQRFREELEKKRWGQVAASENLEISKGMVFNYSSGEIMPPPAKLDWIAKKLGVSTEWLSGESDHKSSPTAELPYLETFGERLNWLIKQDKRADDEVAKALQITKEKLSKILKSKGVADEVVIFRAAQLFKVDEHWLATGIQEKPDPQNKNAYRSVVKIPVVSFVQAGQCVEYTDMQKMVDDVDEFVQGDVDKPNTFALKIKGDSMEPRFKEGDIAIISPYDPIRQGQLVVLRHKTEGVCLKYCTDNGDRYTLTSENPKYAPFEVLKKDVYWVYPVKGIRINLY